jgi:hypothetical protein
MTKDGEQKERVFDENTLQNTRDTAIIQRFMRFA